MCACVRNLSCLRILPLLLFVLVGVPACQTPAVNEARPIPYSAYRPAFADGPPRRTLFLGGYAGYNYGPVSTRTEVPTSEGGALWGYPTARPLFSGLLGR